ncbi:MAG: aspartyl/asparaginyl beta-hydroxylase domain-containing protein [Rhodothalassiaceae bacterium]
MTARTDLSQSPQAQEAYAALRSGDYREARRCLEALLAEAPGDATLSMAHATACLNLADLEAALASVDQVLDRLPRNFAALLLKGDILRGLGDERRAASFYLAAVHAAPPEGQRSPLVQAEIDRAQGLYRESIAHYASFLESRLDAAGLLTGPENRRYAEAIDILFNRRQIYFQQPEFFYFPGLPQVQFYERQAFDWVPALEAQTECFVPEAKAILEEDDGAFQPYLHAKAHTPRLNQTPLYDNVNWSACYLIREGEVVEANARRCPRIMSALKKVPLCDVDGKMPSVLFSLLRPRTRIEPHHGLFNTRLICHLPLIVPDRCYLRVGNETREWRKGEMLIFDDSIEHEAVNDSDELRVILLFDIWRPEFSDRDRDFVRSLFSAIAAYPDVG